LTLPRRQRYFSAWLPPELVDRLRELSRETRVPMAVIMRDALPAALNRWEAERRIDEMRRRPSKRWTRETAAGNWLDGADEGDE